MDPTMSSELVLSLQEEVKALQEYKDMVQDRMRAAARKLAEYREKVQAQQVSIMELKSELQARSSTESLQTRPQLVDELRGELQSLQKTLALRNDTIAELRRQLENKKASIKGNGSIMPSVKEECARDQNEQDVKRGDLVLNSSQRKEVVQKERPTNAVVELGTKSIISKKRVVEEKIVPPTRDVKKARSEVSVACTSGGSLESVHQLPVENRTGNGIITKIVDSFQLQINVSPMIQVSCAINRLVEHILSEEKFKAKAQCMPSKEVFELVNGIHQKLRVHTMNHFFKCIDQLLADMEEDSNTFGDTRSSTGFYVKNPLRMHTTSNLCFDMFLVFLKLAFSCRGIPVNEVHNLLNEILCRISQHGRSEPVLYFWSCIYTRMCGEIGLIERCSVFLYDLLLMHMDSVAKALFNIPESLCGAVKASGDSFLQVTTELFKHIDSMSFFSPSDETTLDIEATSLGKYGIVKMVELLLDRKDWNFKQRLVKDQETFVNVVGKYFEENGDKTCGTMSEQVRIYWFVGLLLRSKSSRIHSKLSSEDLALRCLWEERMLSSLSEPQGKLDVDSECVIVETLLQCIDENRYAALNGGKNNQRRQERKILQGILSWVSSKVKEDIEIPVLLLRKVHLILLA